MQFSRRIPFFYKKDITIIKKTQQSSATIRKYITIMKDFNFYAPTEVVFGANSEEKVASLIKHYGGHKVLVHYGGQSAVKSGLLDKVCGLLSDGGVEAVKLGGVVPNPRLSKVKEGIEICRKEGIDFILAVCGGSVID